MIKIIGRDGRTLDVEGREGWSMMEIIKAAGFHELLATCGGACACATCHVYVEESPSLPAQSTDESDLLSFSDHARPQSRLSCQIRYSAAIDGIRVRIAPEE